MSDSKPELISRRVRTVFADYVTASSTLREIEDAFEGARVPFKPDGVTPSGSQRRTMAAGYFNGLDFSAPADVRLFLDALSTLAREADRMHKVTCDHHSVPWMKSSEPPPEHPMAKLLGELRRCGWEWRDGEMVAVSVSARLADAKSLAKDLDLSHLGEHIARIERSIDADPGLAIGSAKEMVETVCKTILRRRGKECSPKDDILTLGKATFALLKQTPDDIPDAAKGAATIKRMLSNLSSVVQGVAELRGWYGTGHGKDGKAKGLTPRHARLAVGAAATLAWYLLDTDRETLP